MTGLVLSGIVVMQKVLLTTESPQDVADDVLASNVRPDRGESLSIPNETLKSSTVAAAPAMLAMTHVPYGSVRDLRLPPVCVLLTNTFLRISSFRTPHVTFGGTFITTEKGSLTKMLSCLVFQQLRRESLTDTKKALVVQALVLAVALMSHASGECISPPSNIFGITVSVGYTMARRESL